MTMVDTLPQDIGAELDAELEAIEAAKGAEGVSADYLRFTGQVARAQANARAALRSGGAAASPRRQDGVRRVSLDEVHFDDAVLLDLLRDLDGLSTPDVADANLHTLVLAAEEDPGLLRRIVVAATLGDDARPLQEAASHLGLPAPALILIARLLAAPFLVEARRHYGDPTEMDLRGLDPHNSDSTPVAAAGRCPTCTSAASLAVLRAEDGGRRLVCLLCGDTWLAPRLMCVACGSRDQAKLGVLCVSEHDPRWVETCQVCHRYVKTVDQRVLPAGYPLVPRVEDARTLHLDMIAENEGHIRSAW
jgi:formate dehydrogenase maturation protein FdhE